MESLTNNRERHFNDRLNDVRAFSLYARQLRIDSTAVTLTAQLTQSVTVSAQSLTADSHSASQ